MFLRVLLFILFPFLGIVFLSYGLRLPIDGLLLGILLLFPMVMAVFAHYRYIGKLRSQGHFRSARRHLRLWRLLLPYEAYLRMQTELAIEEADEALARRLLQKGRDTGMEAAFVWGMEADLERRLGHPDRARRVLEEALENVPPSLLRAGLLAQQARLFALSYPTQDMLRQADLALSEAEEITSGPPSPLSPRRDPWRTRPRAQRIQTRQHTPSRQSRSPRRKRPYRRGWAKGSPPPPTDLTQSQRLFRRTDLQPTRRTPIPVFCRTLPLSCTRLHRTQRNRKRPSIRPTRPHLVYTTVCRRPPPCDPCGKHSLLNK